MVPPAPPNIVYIVGETCQNSSFDKKVWQLSTHYDILIKYSTMHLLWAAEAPVFRNEEPYSGNTLS
jgi:hypothetical protein